MPPEKKMERTRMEQMKEEGNTSPEHPDEARPDLASMIGYVEIIENSVKETRTPSSMLLLIDPVKVLIQENLQLSVSQSEDTSPDGGLEALGAVGYSAHAPERSPKTVPSETSGVFCLPSTSEGSYMMGSSGVEAHRGAGSASQQKITSREGPNLEQLRALEACPEEESL